MTRIRKKSLAVPFKTAFDSQVEVLASAHVFEQTIGRVAVILVVEVQQMALGAEQLLGAMVWANSTAGLPAVEPLKLYGYARNRETPIPADLWPTRVAQVPTGQDLVGPVEELVLSAMALQHSLAVLPIDEAHERTVEQYIRDNAPTLSGRRIDRRRTLTLPDLG